MALAITAITSPHSGVSSSSSSRLSSCRRFSSVAGRSSPSIGVRRSRSVRCGVATEELGIREAAPSLYTLLGLDQHVELSDIKSAYRQMARKYHPDVCPLSSREECTRLFLQVQDAYEILSDPERRAEYDYHLMHPLSANAYGLGNVGKNSRRSRVRDEGVSEAWKMQWQAQLSRLRRKSQMEEAQPKTSWGAQMRSRAA
ncbi:hypothetical protein R1flu_017086 [Riccia fluitans]|uniref:J domain-containing protein n=1 Tax=Riccia fluitans TaxID=41844 RepID=A0ABD1YP29_9MARC